MILSKEKFDKLFTDFSDAVKEKKYAKMPYQTWNKIKNSLCTLGEKDFVEIKNNADNIRVQFHTNGNVSEFIFSWNDCSFGSFLNVKNNCTAYATSSDFNKTATEFTYAGVRDALENSNWEKVYQCQWDKPQIDMQIEDGTLYTKSGDEWVKTIDLDAKSIIGSITDDGVLGEPITVLGEPITDDKNSVFIPGYATVEDVSDAIATKADKEEVHDIYKVIDEIKQTAGVGLFVDNKKGKNDMNNVFNFDFGPVESECIRMSMYGLAVKNVDGVFVSYDAVAGRLVDVDILNFNGNKFLYKVPVAIKDIKVGDIVVHMRRPVFVTDIQKNSITAVDPHDGEMKTVLLTRSPFGFDFATKVVNFLGDFTAATPDNPFGNMWMFMMMDDNNDKSNLLPLMMMAQGNANMNPMMMYMMMQDRDDMKDILPFMMMMGQNPFVVPAPITEPAVAQ